MQFKKLRLLFCIITFCLMSYACIYSIWQNRFNSLKAKTEPINSISDLKNKTFGVPSGSYYAYNKGIQSLSTKVYGFQNLPTIIKSLETGKLETAVLDKNVADYFCSKFPETLTMIDTGFTEECGFAFAKGNPLRYKVDAILTKLKNEGVIDKLDKKWNNKSTCRSNIDLLKENPLNRKNGVLRVGIDNSYELANYFDSDLRNSGFELDLILEVAKELDKTVEFEYHNFRGLGTALIPGRIDMVAGRLAITDSRKANVDFSIPYYTTRLCILSPIHKADKIEYFTRIKSRYTSVKENLNKLFVESGHWLLLVEAFFTSADLYLRSAVLSFVMAIALFILLHSDYSICRNICDGYIRFVLSIPEFVYLLLLYMIISKYFSLDSFIIVVVGLGLMYAVFLTVVIKQGFEAIPKGEIEEAYALGFSKYSAFFRVFFPQILYKTMPLFVMELTNLLKATAYGSCFAVFDLTAVSLVMQNITLELFLPLAITTIIYLIINQLLLLFLRKVHNKLDPAVRRGPVIC